jgi:methylase of polypeptide subunit release factors
MHPSIRLEGSILSADILDAIERGDKSHQSPKDFGLDPTSKVKDEIADAWAAARAYWAAYQAKVGRLREGAAGTTETRNLFIGPLLELLSYHPSLADSETIEGKTYRISHRDPTRDNLPIHVIGFFESLDRRSTVPNAPRMSPHGLLQEYLNLTEHLYGILTNGRLLRLIRDSSRLVKLSFIEFDLERIFTEELFSDFALLFRLLHASRIPVRQDAAGESPIEVYHQDSLDSGSRIRNGLSRAVEKVILSLANGFLQHPDNHALRERVEHYRRAPSDDEAANATSSLALFPHLLRLVYRLLFLMVIEERGLVHPPGTPRRLREIYDRCYSLARLRRLSETTHFAEARHQDAWLALQALFRLVDESASGEKLGVPPLGGDLFDSRSLGPLADCQLDNATLLGVLRQLSLFENLTTKQRMRVNYGALNVEEFGSVYQGLLEFEPRLTELDGKWYFSFAAGDERSKTGSHYTEDVLVQPLLKHSLDHLINTRLQEARAEIEATPKHLHTSSFILQTSEKALLSLKVADVACGSGHILLAAARRIGVELAILRSGDDQPSPSALREAVRDAIRHCIYGMDLNPLAVELCKVALWLEAHVPGQPLSFLDHRIKCGNAIVGLAHRAELQRGIPDEAFKTLPGDDKDLAAALRNQNKDERKGQTTLHFAGKVKDDVEALDRAYRDFENLPDHDASDYYLRRSSYEKFQDDQRLRNLRLLADAQVAQFYIPKTREFSGQHVTHDLYRKWLNGLHPTGEEIAMAELTSKRKSFAHWFIEFWDVVDSGGFDLIIGNPPYLGVKLLSGSYGNAFCEWVKWEYSPTGLSDLVVYFLRRIYDILRPGGFVALITTNSIKDGDVRVDGLEQVMKAEGNLVFVNRGVRWPGVANLYVALLSIHKGKWENRARFLDGREVTFISSLFEDYDDAGKPLPLLKNAQQVYQGSIFLGDGFLLSDQEAEVLKQKNKKLEDVIFPALNGQEVNSDPAQNPGRQIINFFDWSLEEAEKYDEAFDRVKTLVKPIRDTDKRAARRERWWQYAERATGLYNSVRGLTSCFVTSWHTKYLCFSAFPSNMVFTNAVYVFATAEWNNYSIVQSTLHEIWARKYSGALETRLRYSPTDCFLTFAFPNDPKSEPTLSTIGETYHEHRRMLMRDLWLGLTDLYNLFHAPDLEQRVKKLFDKRVAKSTWRTDEKVPADQSPLTLYPIPEAAVSGIEELRDLHRRLDQTVLAAYGWNLPGPDGPVIDLAHGFHDLDFLPENDRTRFTLHPTARRELLTRLLKLNHTRADEEQNAASALPATKAVRTPKISTVQFPELELGLDLFGKVPAESTIAPAAELASFASAYPSSLADGFICSLTLAMLDWQDAISASDHLDALILVTDTSLCDTLLQPGLTPESKRLLASISKASCMAKQDGLKWSNCIHYLQHRRAINLGQGNPRAICKGSDFVLVQQSLPITKSPIAALALEVTRKLNEIRDRHDLTPNQKSAFASLKRIHDKAYATV